jgi:hypothetical protein
MRTGMKLGCERWLAMAISLVIAAMIVVIPTTGHAAGPWIVAPFGDDAHDCLSPPTACATVNGALAKPEFVPGDTVLMAEGT